MDLKKKIRAIMSERGIPATKALIWALEDRIKKEQEANRLLQMIKDLKEENYKLKRYEEVINNLRNVILK